MDKAPRLAQTGRVSAPSVKSSTAHTATESARAHAAGVQAFLASDDRYRTLFDGLPGLAYLGRADSFHTLDLINQAGRDFLGLKQLPPTIQLAPRIHSEDRARVLEQLQAAASQPGSYAVEYRLRRGPDVWQTVWDQGRAFHWQGHTLLQGQLLDITPHLRQARAQLDAEHQLLQRQKFDALNKLAGGASHEFNNIVAGLLGSAELLAMDIPENSPLYESLRHIFQASNNAREFVQKIRQFAQRLPPSRHPARLQTLIDECLQILRSIIPADKVDLQVYLDHHCPKALVDVPQIQQTLIDLCLQSWQLLADRRGRIRIVLDAGTLGRNGFPEISTLRAGRYARITVHDNSPGLEKHALDRMFDPFHTRRSTGKKIGLEMFQVRETIQAHQGEILVESEPGKGMACFIYLPLAEED